MAGVRSAVIALLDIDPSATTSLRDQIYRGVRQLIVTGRVAAGTLLPSTRVFAQELGVSRNTIVAAFEQLAAEGYVMARKGAGSYVCELLPDDLAAAPTIAGAPAVASLPRSRTMPAPTGAFAIGLPAIDEFPYDVWRKLVAKRWRTPGSLTGYGAIAGLRTLRQQIAAHVAAARGVRCDIEQVFVVAGAHHAFDLIARIVIDRDDAVWVEDPGYRAAGRVFEAAAARLVPVPVDDEGLDVAAGVSAEPRPRLIYVTPSHQFPLGATMSLERRRALLAAAADADAWILEDDYDGEFRYMGRPLASLQGLDREQRVIYVGSFSKVLLPGLRLAYVVVPPALLDLFRELRAVSGAFPPLGDQAVVADFMRDGHFARHIRRMRELYARRAASLVAATRAKLGDVVRIEAPQAGTHAVAHLADGVDDVRVAARAAERGVTVLPLSRQYVGEWGRPGLLLGYGSVRVPAIQRAISNLATLAPFTRVSNGSSRPRAAGEPFPTSS